MSRLGKKCLVASSVLHGFLLLLVLFGSAFFVVKEKPLSQPKLQFVPSKFVEAALAGGGGNPNLPRTDDVQKGSPTAPAQLLAPPPQPVQPKPQPQPAPPPPPKPEVKKPDSPKPEPTVTEKKATPKPADKSSQTKPKIDLSELKPITRADTEKVKAKAEAEAKEAARLEALKRQRLAQQIGKAAEAMQRGFSSGTKVDVGGPGGEAYASYAAFVQAAYENAWKIPPDLNDDDSVAQVRVTIARNGRVTESQIIRRSGNAMVDRSLQRALDKVKLEGLPPFPDFIKEAERTFTIEFNLKTKRLTG